MGASRGSLAEVVTVELALKRALVPLAVAALARESEVVCELLPEVGEYVLGDRRQLTELVAQVASVGVGAARGGDVHVRVARQHAGMAPSDTVLVSVSIRRASVVEDVASVELALPLAERADEEVDARELADVRVLVVVPTIQAARVHATTVRRFGALVESVLDAERARERMRDASRDGVPFDVLYLDDKAPNLDELLRAPGDASVRRARSVLATAVGSGPLRRAFMAGADETLCKPVLPRELCDAIAGLLHPSERMTLPAPSGADERSEPSGGSGRRASGLRNLHLAGVLAALAVAPGGRAR